MGLFPGKGIQERDHALRISGRKHLDGVQPKGSEDKRVGIAQEDRKAVKETQDRLTGMLHNPPPLRSAEYF